MSTTERFGMETERPRCRRRSSIARKAGMFVKFEEMFLIENAGSFGVRKIEMMEHDQTAGISPSAVVLDNSLAPHLQLVFCVLYLAVGVVAFIAQPDGRPAAALLLMFGVMLTFWTLCTSCVEIRAIGPTVTFKRWFGMSRSYPKEAVTVTFGWRTAAFSISAEAEPTLWYRKISVQPSWMTEAPLGGDVTRETILAIGCRQR